MTGSRRRSWRRRMRLPLSSVLHRFLLASHDVARGNALQTLDAMGRRRREHEEAEAFLRELQPDLERRDVAR